VGNFEAAVNCCMKIGRTVRLPVGLCESNDRPSSAPSSSRVVLTLTVYCRPTRWCWLPAVAPISGPRRRRHTSRVTPCPS
jgi:hypothetical protein